MSPTPAPGARPRRTGRTVARTVARHRTRTVARTAALVSGTALLAAGCDAREAYENTFYLGFPDPVTDQGQRIFDLWLGSVAAATVVGVFVYALIFYAMVRYRKRGEELPRQVRYNLPIEVLYTVVPFVVIAVLFYYTAISENYVNKVTKDPQVAIGVVGFQWNWQFNYEKEGLQVTGAPGEPAELVLPTDRTIRFVETSPDVIHSFWVPEFLFKRDVVPGRANTFEITIRQEGRWVGRCAELCGEKHDRMNFYVRAVSPQEYDRFVADQKAKGAAQAAAATTRTTVPTGSSS